MSRIEVAGTVRYLAAVVISVLSCACASAPPPPPPETPKDTEEKRPEKKKPAPQVSSEIGGMNEKDTRRAFESLLRKVEKCQDERRTANGKLDFVAGDVRIEVRVKLDGTARTAYLPKSTLGDRDLEQCIINAAKAMTWPQPEGGEGIAKNEFSLPMKADREAVAWEPAKVQKQLDKAKPSFDSCRKGKGSYEITAYVDKDGSVIAAGASQPTDQVDPVIECIIKTTKAVKMPSPGGWPAKVSFVVELAARRPGTWRPRR
jgi:hypothetical protein